MQDEGSAASSHSVAPASASGVPVAFAVDIAGTGADRASRFFTVTGPDPATGVRRTRGYRLPNTGHHAYLDLFETLARDFGTRVPQNRQRPKPADCTAPFRPLLTRSLSPDILYGYGDPAVTRVVESAAGTKNASYYLVVTSNDAPQAFPILRSRDLTDWHLQGFVFPEGRTPGWAAPLGRGGEYWAPEMHQFGGEFVVCFAAREADHSFSIGLANSSRPEGPFLAAEQPVLRGNVIDPHILVSQDGSAYLFWKEDTNDLWPGRLCQLLHEHDQLIAELFPRDEDRRTATFTQTLWPWARSLGSMERFFVLQSQVEAVTSGFSPFRERLERLQRQQIDPSALDAIADVLRLIRTPIYAQRLDPNRLSLLGERKQVLQNDQEWEGHLVEGIWVTERQGRYYMLYAGNDFSTAWYGIGVAIADSPFGPYRKCEEPLLRSTVDWSGPGHPSVADGPDGEPWLFLHAFVPGKNGYKEFRALLALPIAFTANGIVLQPHAGD